ncbi:MAG: tRNA adenosine(34) deaminase TadA [Pyrinomonadaceae bacterium]
MFKRSEAISVGPFEDMTADEKYMRLALEAANAAGANGEVPIGACITDAEGNVLATAGNTTISDNDPTAHSEINALRMAAQKIGNYRLTECVVYTTIEPCAMCAGALVNSRIGRLVFGARDKRYGAVRTLFELCDNKSLNHRMEISEGVLGDECGELVREFFKCRR